ncbi:hypothetical protein Ddc_19314 [Ditylenchus destructor]|nr:hypothetical protein Ddc_19314 [Ditylenchus destructor]
MPSEVSNVSSGSLSDSSFIKILVQVNFLDTGNEEMCSIKHYSFMTIRLLLFDVFKSLYVKYYKLERVRISNPDLPFSADCQIMNIKENPAFMYAFVHASRIYNFEVRLIVEEA